LGGSTKSSSGGIEGTVEGSITLFSTATKSDYPGLTGEETKDHADARKEAEDANGDTGLYDVYSNAFIIVVLALIIGLIAVIAVFGNMFNFGPAIMKKFGAIFCILTFIFALIAVLYFMTAYPSESEMKTPEGKDAGFWYSDSGTTTEMGVEVEYDYTLGPGYSWYLMLIGAILALISAIFLFMDKGAVAAPPQ